MKLNLHKLLHIVTSLSLFVNSISAPFSVYAQELNPSAEPTFISEATQSPEPSAFPSEEASLSPTEVPVASSIPSQELVVSTEPPDVPVVTQFPDVTQSLDPTPLSSEEPKQESNSDSGVEPTPRVTTEAPKENGHINAIILNNTKAESVEGFDLTYQDEGSARIQTDKLDYAPTDTVLITGSGFLPNAEYDIEVTSDTGNFKFTDRVTSDEAGGLFYSYQLDGTYRPNYWVGIKDGSVIKAETTFTDSQTITSISLNGTALTGSNSVSVLTGSTISVVINTNLTGNSDWKGTEYGINVSNTTPSCFNNNDHTNDGSFTETFSITAPSTPGTYNANFKIDDKNGCNGIESGLSSFVNSVIVTALPVSSEINYNNFEGEIAPQGSENWTNGNISGYKEGDTIRFRTDITSTGVGTGSIFIGFTSDPTCRFFAYELPTNVSITGTGLSVVAPTSLSQNGDDAVAEFGIVSTGASNGKLNYTLHVSDNAAACASGSSQHVQVDHATGDVKDSGAKALPIPASAVAPVTDISFFKSAPTSTSINNSFSYSISVTNLDSTTAESVIVTDTLPTGVSYVSSSWTKTSPSATGSCSVVGQLVTCNLSNLSGNASASITINVNVNNDSRYCGVNLRNSASVSTTTLESDYQNNSSQTDTLIDQCSAHLIVIKHVVNNYGGTNTAADFTLTINGVTAEGGNSFPGAENPGVDKVLSSVGTYSVSEIGPSGYSTTYSTDCSGTIALNETKTCTVVNSDIQPKLKVTKIVNGGTSQPGDFDLFVGTTQVVSGVSNGFNAATYNVSEDGNSVLGYTTVSYGGSCNSNGQVTLNVGDDKECTITNTRDTGNLKVQKIVDYGDATDWLFSLDGGTAIRADANGIVDFGQVTTLDTHTISETGPNTFYLDSITGTNCSSSAVPGRANATVSKGGTTICTFTNKVNKGSITIIKDSNPNDSQDFAFTAQGTGISGFSLDDDSDVTLSNTKIFSDLFPGSYTISEVTNSSWNLSSLNCVSDIVGKTVGPFIGTNSASFNLEAGEDVTCTFTNNKIPTLTVTKIIDPTNDQGLFNLLIDDNQVATNVGNGITSNPLKVDIGVMHQVSETAGTGTVLNNYIATFGGDCNAQGQITLAAGENKNCTITNTLQRGSVTAHKFVDFDKNGVQDSGEPNQAYFQMSLYQGNNCSGSPISQLDTQSDGNAVFNDLLVGDYSVKETLPVSGGPGLGWWTNITPLCQNVHVTHGQNQQVNFANFKVQELTVCKYNDVNGDGIWQSGDNRLSGWTINLSGPENLSGVTGADGCVRIPINIYGGYEVTEVLKSGWIQTFPSSPQTGYVTYNTTSGLQLYNFQLGKISGNKFNDLNSNGVKDVNEPGLESWTIYLDKNLNSILDAGDISTVTDGDGNYQFTNLTAGTYHNNSYAVREVLESGWTQTYPNGNVHYVSVTSGTNATGIDFGNFEYGKITACKYEDFSGNGLIDNEDSLLPGVSIKLMQYGDVIDTKTTGENGCVTFDELVAGDYRIEEDLNDPDLANYFPISNINASTYYEFTITSGFDETKNFFNALKRTISGYKYNDLNTNGTMDNGEPGLSGWNIYLDMNSNNIFDQGEPSTLTDQNGYYEFSDLVIDHYFPREDLTGQFVTGNWVQSEPNGGEYDVDTSLAIISDNKNFGNWQMLPKLEISKTNDKPSAGNGDVINYTLKVKNSGNVKLGNVEVIDVLPGGFEYINGSSKIDNIVQDPVSYAGGVLTWLIDLAKDQEIVITYQTKVGSNLKAGIYTNLATCKTIRSEQILERLFVSELFISAECNDGEPVSSTVTLGSSYDYSGNLSPQVLGASTELPATGSPTAILIIAIGVGIMGFVLKKKEQKYEKN